MIKCGKLEGTDQCILYSKDGSKVLGRFSYSKYGGQKGAKAAAHKREGQIQFFKKKHQSLLDALETFGAPAVLKYVLDGSADCEGCQEVLKAHVADWLEKARGQGQGVGGARQADGGADQCVCPECGATAAHEKGTPCNKQKCPKCGASMQGQSAEKSETEAGEEVEKARKKKDLPFGGSFSKMWSEVFGGSVEKCITMMTNKVTNPGAYCAWMKDKALRRTTWRGKGKHEMKSFDETVEEARAMLQKDEEMELEDVDLGELEQWLSQWEEGEETPAVEAEPTPEPEPEAEPLPAPEAEEVPEPENTFVNFLRSNFQERQARMREMVLAQTEEEHHEHGD